MSSWVDDPELVHQEYFVSTTPKESTKGGKPRKGLRMSAYILGGCVIVPVVLFVFFLMRLQSDPISVPFVGQAIERAVNRALEGSYLISVDGAVLEPGAEGLVALRLTGMRLFNDSGKMVGAAPFASAEIDLWSFFRFQPTARSVTLIGPVMVLKWGRSGKVELVPGLVPGQRPPDRPLVVDSAEDNTRELIESGGDFLTTGLSSALEQAFANMPVSSTGLRRLEVQSAILRVEHEETGAIWRVAPINFTSSASETERVFDVSASVLEGSKPWFVRGRISGNKATGDKNIVVGIDDLVLASATGPLAQFAGIPLNVPFSSRFGGTLARDGEWRGATFDVSLGQGIINLGKNALPLDFQGADLELVYEAGRWAIRNFDVDIADTSLSLRGVISPVEDEAYILDLTANYMAGESSALATTLPEARAIIRGTLDLGGRTLNLNTLRLETPDLTLAADAYGEWREDGLPTGFLIGTASEINVRDMKALWPSFVLPEPREWAFEHLSAGVAKDIFYRFGLTEDGELVREMEARVEEASFGYLDDLPPVRGGFGTLRLEGDIFTATLENGYVEPVPGGAIDISGTVYTTHLTPLDVPDRAELDLRIDGEVEPIFYFLDLPPLELISQSGLQLTDLQGFVDGRALLTFDLVPDLEPEDVNVNVTARLREFEADGIVPDQRLTAGNFLFTQYSEGLVLEGNGRLAGGVITLTATRENKPEALVKYNAAMTLDAEARRNLGIDINDFVTGPVRVVFSGEGEGLPDTFDIDLTNAEVSLPQLGYVKEMGVGAQANVKYREEGDILVLNEVAYDSGLVSLRGRARVHKTNGLVSASFPTFRFNEGDDLSIEIEKGRLGFNVDVRGARFNLEPYLKANRFGGGDDSPIEPFRLNASIGALIGADEQILRNVILTATHDGTYLRNFDLSATHADGGVLRGWQEDLTVNLQTVNAGSLFRFMGIYPFMQDGRLVLVAEQTPSMINGTFEVTDFRLANDRVVAAVTTRAEDAAEFRNLRQSASQGVQFDLLSVSYFYTRGKQVELHTGRLKGPTLGATAKGIINLEQDDINIRGTFVPAYALNNAFSQVPIVGRLLGGHPDQGLFGINFDVTGSMEDPQVSVNPLSAITPGIFRNIFN